jgi:hypothetical protein
LDRVQVPRTALLLLVVLAGCRHVSVTAQPSALARHSREFAAAGWARVDVEQGGTTVVNADDHVVYTIPGNQKSRLWGLVKTGRPDQTAEVTVGTFVAGCAAGSPDCLAQRATGSLTVGTRRELDPGKLGIFLFGALGAIVGTACLAICDRPDGWAYAGTAIGYGVMITPLFTVY